MAKKTTKKGRPRGSKAWAENWKDLLCERMADGRSMRSVSKDEDMPCKSVIMKHLKEDAGFADQYARAGKARADAIFEECLEIADQADGDIVDGEVDIDHIQRARLRIDTRKWAVGKMNPKKYGRQVDVTSGGGKITQPQGLDVSKLSTAVLAEIMAANDALNSE